MENTYGFIGCGNMGGALIRAAVKAVPAQQVFIADALKEKAEALSRETGAVLTDTREIAAHCRYIFLGVKPQMMEDLLTGLQPVFKERTEPLTLITMAAGLSMEKIRAMAGDPGTIIRMMPNLAASVGEAMILYASDDASEEELEAFRLSMSHAGQLCMMKESLIDAGSAVSGCGPAFVFLFIEAMADEAVRLGLTRADAYLLASQTLLGSAKLMQETGSHPAALKDAVCSPGGTTIAGVLSLEKDGFRSSVASAVEAAYIRTLELK